jgi:hypothetical protein
MIVTLQAKPQRYTIETIDMRTGRATNTKIVARPDVRTVWAPHLAARQGSTLYLVGGAQLVVLDLEAGAVLYEGP